MSGLHIRDAVESDLPALADISRKTWDGDDYLESTASSWIADGGFLVGELEGRVIGCFKITRLPGSVAWLEGLRVHPDYKGRGLGRILAEDSFVRASAMRDCGEIDWIEFETYYHNLESIAICTSRGFEVVEKFSLLYREFEPRPGSARGTAAAISDKDLDAYRERVPSGWKAYLRTPGLPSLLGSRNDLFDIDGIRFFAKPGERLYTPCSSALSSPLDAALAIEDQASRSGFDSAEAMIPSYMEDAREAFLSAGWDYWEEPREPNAWVFRMAWNGTFR